MISRASKPLSPSLLLWSGTLLLYVHAASFPLNVQSQSILAWSLLALLAIIQANYTRIEQHLGASLRLFRLIVIFLAVFITLRYLAWRLTSTIGYHDPLSLLGALLLLAAELYGIAVYFLGAFVNAFPIKRTPPPLPEDPNLWPTVDILVPTYNEDPEMLETTLLAATQIHYPQHRFKVYLCDDGGTLQRRNRPDPAQAREALERHETLQALCAEVGAHYLTREKNLHAKAGNINSALEHCHGELVVILDADHVPTVDFLQNTVGFFLHDPKLFLVQTPHYFINPDPLERNLRTFEHMPSENEMFYTVIQHGLDFWNASFFCGSAAVLRRELIDKVGGVAGETITEDAETAMGLHGLGYNSVYYGKPMVAGLQPETFSGFTVQRMRWAQGMVQIFLLKNPWMQPNMSISQRLAYTSSVFFWFFPFARVVFLIVPGFFLLFGLRIYDANLQEFLAYALPHILAAILMSNALYGKTRWPFVSELYETVQSVYSLPAIIEVLRNPRSPSFAVTPKGERLDEDFVSSLAKPFYILLLLNILFMTAGALRLIFQPELTSITVITMAWAGINVIFILAAIGIMLEKAQKRAAYRINTQRTKAYPMSLEYAGQKCSCTLVNISHSGLAVHIPHNRIVPELGDVMSFDIYIPALDRLGHFHATVEGIHKQKRTAIQLGLSFKAENQTEKRTIVGLVYGWSELSAYNQQARQKRISPLAGLGYLYRTALFHAWEHVAFLSGVFSRDLLARLSHTIQALRARLVNMRQNTASPPSLSPEKTHEKPH
ncbi:MAG: cellulose synthase catalytic subunit (UDP-forming) [Gammaproteobacteria bacterium 28-57-27]|nr:MAG: cellulose synthase catalytic subunit (UDP-forming) [Gammaproteobacteria bacterium 28-57-27]